MRVLYTKDGFIYINMSLEVSLKDNVLMLRAMQKLYFVCNPTIQSDLMNIYVNIGFDSWR